MEVLARDEAVIAAEASRPPARTLDRSGSRRRARSCRASLPGAVRPIHGRQRRVGTGSRPGKARPARAGHQGLLLFHGCRPGRHLPDPAKRMAGGPAAARRSQPCGRHPDRAPRHAGPGQSRPRLGRGRCRGDGRDAGAGDRRLHRRAYSPDGLRGPHPPCRRRRPRPRAPRRAGGALPALGAAGCSTPISRATSRSPRSPPTTNSNATAPSAPARPVRATGPGARALPAPSPAANAPAGRGGSPTGAATRWSRSAGWTGPPPSSSTTRCRACRSAPRSSPGRRRATSARNRGASAPASPSSTRCPSASSSSSAPWCPTRTARPPCRTRRTIRMAALAPPRRGTGTAIATRRRMPARSRRSPISSART